MPVAYKIPVVCVFKKKNVKVFFFQFYNVKLELSITKKCLITNSKDFIVSQQGW